MITLKAKLRAPALDTVRYVSLLENTARDTLSRAMLEYVTTFQAIVPVWSGASHGTLTHLASLISAPLAINPSSTSWIQNGPGYGARRSDAYYDDSDGLFTFTYETDLPHLVYNEENDANTFPDPGLRGKLLQPGPYNFVDQTNGAVQAVLQNFDPPNLGQYIRAKRVR
jgi:hypothetical protein